VVPYPLEFYFLGFFILSFFYFATRWVLSGYGAGNYPGPWLPFRMVPAVLAVVSFGAAQPSLLGFTLGQSFLPPFFYNYSNLLLAVGLLLICYAYYRSPTPQANVYINILSTIFALSLLVGDLYKNGLSLKYPFSSLENLVFYSLIFMGFFFLFQLFLVLLFSSVTRGRVLQWMFPPKTSMLSVSSPVKQFFWTFFWLSLAWSPYLFVFYPGILSWDPTLQLRQFFGEPNMNSQAVDLVDPEYPITNHHPYLHTFIIGNLTRFGIHFGSFNLGLFSYTLLQFFSFTATLSYGLSYLRILGVNAKVLRFYFLALALFPVFPYYAVTPFKDAMFTCAFIFFVIFLHQLSLFKYTRLLGSSPIIPLFASSFFLMLLRHNGILIVVMSLVGAWFVFSKHRLALGSVLVSLLAVFIFFNGVLLPYVKVSPGPSREKYSLPLQQTARYVKLHPELLSQDEYDGINKVLPFDKLAELYDPELSDPVKATFNSRASGADLANYFRVWAIGLSKAPIVYLDATLNNTYAYFYFLEVPWVVISKPQDLIQKLGYEYTFPNPSVGVTKILRFYARIFVHIPILGLLVNGAFILWLVLGLFFYLLYIKHLHSLVYFLPYFGLFFFFLISPANGHYRYFLPMVASYPFLYFIVLYNVSKFSLKA